jgi:hypothetical protein
MRLVFTAAILVNALLIFWVELLFARKLLPTLGGAPAIWNTCLMFYQVLLLGGYAYALLVTRLELRRQLAVHGVLLLAVVAGLPWFLFVWPDPAGQSPVGWLIALLTVSLGAPFFVLAAGAPLLQRWFSLSSHRDRADPYFLYAASNLGSFLALAAYPILFEPLFTLERQVVLWKGSYAVVTLLVLVCGVWALRAGRRAGAAPLAVGDGDRDDRSAADHPASPAPLATITPGGAGGPLSLRRRLRWVGLAFIPSSLLLGVTTHITSEIAPVPLLWVVPLALYLLTFVLAFGPGRVAGAARPRAAGRGRAPTRAAAGAGVALLALGAAALAGVPLPDPAWLLILADLGILTAAGLVCHTRVARDRPDPRHLAEFYLLLALGGALGGVFNTLIAPLVFTDPLEYPIVVAVLAFLVASGPARRGRTWRAQDIVLGLTPGLLALAAIQAAPRLGLDPLIALVLPGVLCLALAGRPVRFGLAVSGFLLVGFMSPMAAGEVVFKERTFYGIHRVYRDGDVHWLAHGTTIHGGQRRGSPEIPLTYYHPAGPAASLFAAFDQRPGAGAGERIANVGLGTGSLIAYGRPGQEWSLYELDPMVIRIAEDERFFTYLRDTGAEYRHVLGDARLSLERSVAVYDLIVIDAFSSDAIPVHLMTREAVELYLARLRAGGIIAFHISNRYADFSGVVADLAGELGLNAYEARDEAGDEAMGYYPSHWAVLSSDPVSFPDPRWQPLEPTGRRVWTDSYSSLFRVLTW